jgi:two-component system sensor histidine kinase DegS
MEFNFYRIVQQACENSIYHAQPTMIRIDGELSRDKILITIEDNGVGFPQGERLDLSGLLTSGHYGVANMIERAESHQGSLKINSTAGKGTTITLTWGSPLLP